MARVKRAVNAKKNHRKVLKLAKGYYGAKSKLFKTANETVIRAQRNSYIGRKLKKSYSRFMNGLKIAGIDINRKMLSEIAIYDPKAFTVLVETAKSKLA